MLGAVLFSGDDADKPAEIEQHEPGEPGEQHDPDRGERVDHEALLAVVASGCVSIKRQAAVQRLPLVVGMVRPVRN